MTRPVFYRINGPNKTIIAKIFKNIYLGLKHKFHIEQKECISVHICRSVFSGKPGFT